MSPAWSGPNGGFKGGLKTLSYFTAKALAWPIVKVYFRAAIHGRDLVPERGGFLLAANHFSFVDPVILGTMLPRRLRFVMAEDQFERPALRAFSRLMDVIPVQAGATFRLGPIKKCLTALKAGRVVAIFPEGQRSESGKLLPPMPGVGVLAARSGVPVVPVAVAGTRETFPRGHRFPRPGRVTLFVGAPLTLAEGEAPDSLAQRAMGAIAGLLRENGFEDYVSEE